MAVVVQQQPEQGAPAVDVVPGVENVPAPVLRGVQLGHPVEGGLSELHEPVGVGVGLSVLVEAALGLDHRVDQVLLQAEFRRLPGHQLPVGLGVQKAQARLHQLGAEKERGRGDARRQNQYNGATFFHRLFSSGGAVSSARMGATASSRGVLPPVSTR